MMHTESPASDSPSFVRVLIIEDDPAIAANLYDFLAAGGTTWTLPPTA